MWLQSHVMMLINKEQHFEEKYRLDHSFRRNKQSIYAGVNRRHCYGCSGGNVL